MNNIILIIYLVVVTIFAIGVTIYAILESKKENNEENINVDLLNILLTSDSASKIDTVLDQFIISAGDNYTLFKLSQNPNHYITEEIQKEMIMYIFASVKKNMTREMRTLIGLIHVINSEKDLDDLLNLRIKMYVLNFMVDYNQPLDDGTKLL